MKIAVLFDNLGPYHKARLQACVGKCDLLAVEFGSISSDYAWQNEPITGIHHAVCNSQGSSRELTLVEFRSHLGAILREFSPNVVAIPGWGKRGALLVYEWCIENHCPSIVMSESTVWDELRFGSKEVIKRRVISLASSALVGGAPHQEYIQQLGMAPDCVFLGYDVVNNDFFATECLKCRKPEINIRARYFLASNRFIERKNLFRLIESYAAVVKDLDGHRPPLQCWDLCLLGDGEQKAALIAHCQKLGLQVIEAAPWESSPTTDNRQPTTDSSVSHSHLTPLATSGPARKASPTVFFPGFRQIDELPRFYAGAGCFIHPALTEPWGLVVNEAMASGLPVIVSNRVGCSRDLVQDGVNGFTFDPTNVEALADLMKRVSAPEFPREEFGEASRRIIASYGPDAFASGLEAAARKALEVGPKRPSLTDRMLLNLLCRVR